MIQTVTRFLGLQPSPIVVVECRHCGANLDDVTQPCPECGNGEAVRYRL